MANFDSAFDKPNLCRLCGHEIYSHDRQYGCAEDGCDCETPNADVTGLAPAKEVNHEAISRP